MHVNTIPFPLSHHSKERIFNTDFPYILEPEFSKVMMNTLTLYGLLCFVRLFVCVHALRPQSTT